MLQFTQFISTGANQTKDVEWAILFDERYACIQCANITLSVLFVSVVRLIKAINRAEAVIWQLCGIKAATGRDLAVNCPSTGFLL